MICTSDIIAMLGFWAWALCAAEAKGVLRGLISPERGTCCWLFLRMKSRTQSHLLSFPFPAPLFPVWRGSGQQLMRRVTTFFLQGMILMPSRAEVSCPFVLLLLKDSYMSRQQDSEASVCARVWDWGGAGPAFSSCCCHLILGTFLLLRNSISSWFHMILGCVSEEERKYCIVSFTFSKLTWKSLGSMLVKALPLTTSELLSKAHDCWRESCGAESWF